MPAHLDPTEFLPYASYRISAALTALRRQCPWPATASSRPFDRRGLFGRLQQRALVEHLPESPCLILEIGSFTGASTRFFLEMNPSAYVITVDDFAWQIPAPDDLSRMLSTADIFYANCRPYRDRLTSMRMRSNEALALLAALGVRPDFVYVDGAHDYHTVKSDILGSLRLNPHAIVIGDDYMHPDYDGLRAAVSEAAAEVDREARVLHGYLFGLFPRGGADPRDIGRDR